MGKVKSALFLTLVTIMILGLTFMSAVSFDYGGYLGFRSFLVSTQKDALIGNDLTFDKDAEGEYVTTGTGSSYVGGGYSVVYYPDGVLSRDAYEDELEARRAALEAASEEDKEEAQKAVTEYEEGYAKKGSLYFKIGTYDEEDADKQGVATKGDTLTVDEKFEAAFQAAVSQIKTRVRELGYKNSRVDVRDDYSVEIFLPALKNASAQAAVFSSLGQVGEFDLRYGGENAEDAEGIVFAEGEDIHDYVKSAYYVSNGGSPSVAIRFTKAGREAVKAWTADASGSTYVYFYVGDSPIIPLRADQQIDQSTLYVSGSYTAPQAKAVALAINTALNGEATDLNFSVGEVYSQRAQFGSLALTLLYAACGILAVAILAFFFIRYHRLGFVFLYAFLILTLLMIVLIWGIPFLYLGIETFLAVLFGMVLLSVSNIAVFEAVRKEYAQGKTMGTCVKNGYKKCFWGIFDAHIVLALISFVTFFIALGELATFAFTLGIATVLSGLITLAVGRFHWACMMSFAKDKGKFCNFKREELEDE